VRVGSQAARQRHHVAPTREQHSRLCPKLRRSSFAVATSREGPQSLKLGPARAGFFRWKLACGLDLLCAAKLSPKPTRERLHNGNKKDQHQISSDRKAKPQSSISVLLHCQT
jgi:hypothetical protein